MDINKNDGEASVSNAAARAGAVPGVIRKYKRMARNATEIEVFTVNF